MSKQYRYKMKKTESDDDPLDFTVGVEALRPALVYMYNSIDLAESILDKVNQKGKWQGNVTNQRTNTEFNLDIEVVKAEA